MVIYLKKFSPLLICVHAQNMIRLPTSSYHRDSFKAFQIFLNPAYLLRLMLHHGNVYIHAILYIALDTLLNI